MVQLVARIKVAQRICLRDEMGIKQQADEQIIEKPKAL